MSYHKLWVHVLPEVSGFQDRGIRLLENSVRHELKVFDEPKGEVEFHFIHTKPCDTKQRYEAGF